ncbi:class I adenylate-forming enzyme family protein [Cellvibrio sp. UBA7671]|uniref:class I adenylate-forming enzyme family protein n=1 Tax=Cellvibrio sp. UBA7671 TaxID=1946312 RepID=UPI002F350C95
MLISAFDKIALSNKDKVAIYGDCGSYTYGELYEQSVQFAQAIESAGLARRVSVAVESPSRGEFVAIYLACARLGICIVPIDTRLSEEELLVIIEDASPAGVITFSNEGNLSKALAGMPYRDSAVDIHSACLLRVKEEILDNSLLQDGDLVIQYSSGSTGKPKGVVLSRDNIYHKIKNWNETISANENDRYLNTLTLGHCYGLYVHTLSAILAGAQVFMMDVNSVIPNRITKIIKEEKISVFGSLPYMYQMFNRMSPASVDFSSVRYLISGSAPLSANTWEQFEEKFGRGINQVYGLTEIGLIMFNVSNANSGSIGQPTANMEVLILDNEGRECPLGESGEMVVRCKSMSRGYLNNPHDQASMFKNGWLYTKDIVKQAEAGNYEICGRISQFINVSGNKVSPLEVEEHISRHPEVIECAVIGMRNENTIEQVVAYVVKQEGSVISAKDIMVYSGSGLAKFKVPTKVLFIDMLPKSPLGKILKAKLG